MKSKEKRYNGFSKIDSILKKNVKEKSFELALFRYQAIKHWKPIVAEFVAQAENLTQAIDLKKGILTIVCLSKDVAFKIKLLAQRIIYELNKVLGKQVVFVLNIET